MIIPGKLDLRVMRWQPFLYEIDFVGLDFSAADLSLHVRLYPDATGDPIIALGNAVPPAEGLSAVVVTTAGVPTSTVRVRINETTIEGVMPFPGSGARPCASLTLAYDLVITGGGLAKTRWLEGAFTIKPGVTQ